MTFYLIIPFCCPGSKLMSAFRCMHVEMRSIGCPTSQSQSFVVYTYSQLVPPGVDVTLEDVSRIFIRPEVSSHANYACDVIRRDVTGSDVNLVWRSDLTYMYDYTKRTVLYKLIVAASVGD